MIEVVEAFLDVVRHEDVNILVHLCGSIVPFEHETTIVGASPINCNFLPLLYCFNEVQCIFHGCVMKSKVIHS